MTVACRWRLVAATLLWPPRILYARRAGRCAARAHPVGQTDGHPLPGAPQPERQTVALPREDEAHVDTSVNNALSGYGPASGYASGDSYDLVNNARMAELPDSAPDFKTLFARFTGNFGRGRRTVTNQICRTAELDVEFRQPLQLLDRRADVPAQVEPHLAMALGNDAIAWLTAGAPVVRPGLKGSPTRDDPPNESSLSRLCIREPYVAAIGRAPRLVPQVVEVDAGSRPAHLLHAKATALREGEAVTREARCFTSWVGTPARAQTGLTTLGRGTRETTFLRPFARAGHEADAKQ